MSIRFARGTTRSFLRGLLVVGAGVAVAPAASAQPARTWNEVGTPTEVMSAVVPGSGGATLDASVVAQLLALASAPSQSDLAAVNGPAPLGADDVRAGVAGVRGASPFLAIGGSVLGRSADDTALPTMNLGADARWAVGDGAAAAVGGLTSLGNLSITGSGLLTNGGVNPLVFGAGSVTSIGGGRNAATNRVDYGGRLDVGAAGAVVSGGTFVNNGLVFGLGPVVVENGGVLKGSGSFDTSVIVRNGGVFSPGNSPGRNQAVSQIFLAPSTILIEIDNTLGSATPGANGGAFPVTGLTGYRGGFDVIEYGSPNPAAADQGRLLFRGNPVAGGTPKITLNLVSQVFDGTGPTNVNGPLTPATIDVTSNPGVPRTIAVIFRPTTDAPTAPDPRSPTVLNLTAPIIFQNASSATIPPPNLNEFFAVNTAGLRYDPDGAGGAPDQPLTDFGTVSLAFVNVGGTDRAIGVTFTPVPEPATVLGLIAVGGLGVSRLRRRKPAIA